MTDDLGHLSDRPTPTAGWHTYKPRSDDDGAVVVSDVHGEGGSLSCRSRAWRGVARTAALGGGRREHDADPKAEAHRARGARPWKPRQNLAMPRPRRRRPTTTRLFRFGSYSLIQRRLFRVRRKEKRALRQDLSQWLALGNQRRLMAEADDLGRGEPASADAEAEEGGGKEEMSEEEGGDDADADWGEEEESEEE